MRPFWHPLSALVVPDPPMFATTRILQMFLLGGKHLDLIYAGDRMGAAVRHGQRFGIEGVGSRSLREGEAVVAASDNIPELLRVERVANGSVVLRADADCDFALHVDSRAVVARAHLPVVRVSESARRRARLRIDLAEAWSARPDAAPDPATTVREKYHAQAPFYAGSAAAPIDPNLLGRMRSDLRSGATILVAGSGAGGETIALAAAGFRARGVDFAPAMVEAARVRARAAGADVAFVEADLRRHVEPPRSLDAVLFTYEVYSFLPDRRDRIALLRGMRDWLAPDGKVYLSARRVRTRFERMILSIQRARGRANSWGDSHTRRIAVDGTMHRSFIRLFTERELEGEIAAAGFRAAAWVGGHCTLIPSGQSGEGMS